MDTTRTRPVGRSLVAAATAVAVLVGVATAAGVTATTASAGAAVEWGDLDTAGLVELAPPDPDLRLTLYLGLVHDRSARDAYARAVSDPVSPRFGERPGLAAIVDRFGPADATVDAVVGFLRDRDLPVEVGTTRSYVRTELTIATAEELLDAQWGRFSAPDGFYAGMDLLIPTTTPRLPDPLADLLDTVHGAVAIDIESAPVTSNGSAVDAADAVAGPDPGPGTPTRTGTPQGCAAGTSITAGGQPFGLAPNQVLTASGIDELHAAGLRGEGTTVAVVDDASYDPAWLAEYRSCFGLSDATAVTEHRIGAPGTAESGETILDLSIMSFVAPRVDRLDVFMVQGGRNPDISDDAGDMIGLFAAPFDLAATGGVTPDVVSASFALCEASPAFWGGRTAAVRILEDVLASAAAAGSTVAVATGDSGSSGCVHNLGGQTEPEAIVRSASYPSTSQWVTAVGGTQLSLDDDNQLVELGAWNSLPWLAGGAGGGVSSLVPRPWFQDLGGVAPASGRSVPDVSLFASSLPGYAIFDGTWSALGGTSAATPVFAGLAALLAQAATSAGQPTPGFVTPLLYRLAAGGSDAIEDVRAGSIDLFGVGCCDATVGHDLATGWGSPVGDRLVEALAPPAVRIEAPARLATPGAVELAATVAVAAGEVLEYRWDTDGDGVVDRVTAEPSVRVALDRPGTVAVSVQVRTSLGRTATAVAALTVEEPATPITEPSRPAGLAFVG